MGAEGAGHGGQHAGGVGDLQVHVVRAGQVVDRADLGPGPGGHRPVVAPEAVGGGVDHVAQHGGGGGAAAGAAAVEHQLAGGGALHEHGVEAVPHGGQGMVDGHHGRVDPYPDLPPGPGGAGREGLGHGQQLDLVAQAVGVVDVGVGEAGDALVVHVARHHLLAEGDRGQDGGLGPGVVALHVGRGVTLGVAQVLGLGQGLGVADAVGAHPGEDVVGGAVDDAEQAGHVLAQQRLPQGAHDRDGTGHGRLEQEVDAGGVGVGVEVGADVGQQLLVAGDDGLARAQRALDQAAGRLDAADDLHHEVDRGVVDHRLGVGGEQGGVELTGPFLGDRADGHPGQLQLHAAGGGDGGPAFVQQLDEGTTDDAATQESDSHGERE